jgi:thiol-disulfide isomerase/thioredoxin
MKRDSVVILAISLCSILAGALIYRFAFFEAEFVSANPILQNEIKPTVSPISYPEIVLSDLEGLPQPLKKWQQQIQILNFWAPWCAPCRREIPVLVDLQNTYKDSVQIIGLSFDSQKNVIDFINKYPINYPLLLVQHESAQINHFFGNTKSGLPFTVILDRKRDIVYRHVGEITATQLEQEINALL